MKTMTIEVKAFVPPAETEPEITKAGDTEIHVFSWESELHNYRKCIVYRDGKEQAASFRRLLKCQIA